MTIPVAFPGARALLCFLLVLAAPAQAQAPLPAPRVTLDNIDTIAMSLGTTLGYAAAATWHKGAAAYVATATNLPERSDRDQDQLFEIGSISKVFTGLLLAQEIEAGRLTLDDSLGKLLGAKTRLPANVAAITLRQLVTHTSCLPRLSPGFDFAARDKAADPYAAYDRARLWASLSRVSLAQAPPCAGDYSNYGFAVLGELLAERAGKPWETLVRERIAEPLGMTSTRQHLGSLQARLVPGFDGSAPVAPWNFDAYAGAGALRATAADMLVFGRALMAGRGGPLGAVGQRMLEPLATFGPDDIGYALLMRGPAGRRYYHHAGATGGYRAYLAFMPDTQDVVVALAGNVQAPVDRIGVDLQAARYTLADTRIDIDPARLADYAGVFRISPKAAFTFVVQDGKLYGRLTGQRFAPLTPSAPDTFMFPGVGAEFGFTRSEGRVAAVTLRQNGGILAARLVPEPPPERAVLAELTQEAYGGDYAVERPGAGLTGFKVLVSAGQMFIQPSGQAMMPVFPVPGQPDRYAWDVVQAEVAFERNGDGSVRALVLHQNGVALRAARGKAGAQGAP